MPYNEKVAQLAKAVSELDYVQDFRKTEAKLRANTELFSLQNEMKQLQKDAVLYKKIGKMQAFKETSQAAQKIEKKLKKDLLVEQYFIELKDVNDLAQYVTHEIEQKVNHLLENDEK